MSIEDNYTTEYVEETLIIKPEHLDDLCRLCANTDNQLMPIFSGEGAEHNIINKIKQHLPIIKVTEHDNLPLNICYHCASNLIAWHNLYEGCKAADARLRQLFGEVIKTDQDDEEDAQYEHFGYDDETLDYNDDSGEHFLNNIIQLSPTSGDIKTAIEYDSLEDAVQEVITQDDIPEENDLVIDCDNQNVIIGTEGIEIQNLTEEQRKCCYLIDVQEAMTQTHSNSGDRWKVNVCDICNKYFASAYNLSKHMLVHSDERFYECRLCSQSFDREDSMINHMRLVHQRSDSSSAVDTGGGNVVEAAISAGDSSGSGSGYSFNDSTSERRPTLLDSTKKAAGRPRFHCDICGKPFLSKFNLNQHSLTHSGKKTVECDVCNYKCYTKSQLDVHKAKHNKRFCCEKCSKMFVYRFQLETHLQSVHYNLRPYRCELCNKYFKTKYNLGSHMAMHKNIRNFHCLYCTHKCRTNYDLKIHIRTHTREKPYSCSYCGRCFNQKGDRAKHERLHIKYQNQPTQQTMKPPESPHPIEIYLTETSIDNIISTVEDDSR